MKERINNLPFDAVIFDLDGSVLLDSPDNETICGIGNKKNLKFNELLKKQGDKVYSSTVQFIKILKKSGIRVGMASSSKNCKTILESVGQTSSPRRVGIEELFKTRVDDEVSVQLGFKEKSETDIFVTAARNMGTIPAKSVVVEDAVSGIEAGRNGGFGLVVGVARKNNEAELIENGADIILRDLSEISIEWIESWFHKTPEVLFDYWDKPKKNLDWELGNRTSERGIIINSYYKRSGKETLLSGKKLLFFLDYDGTITPIVHHPELAVLSEDTRGIIKKLSQKFTVAIISGRMRKDIEKLVNIKGIFYAGSHGFDIAGPRFSMIHPKAEELIPAILEITKQISKEIGNIPGILIEEKKFSIAVHYRLVDVHNLPKIKTVINNIIRNHKALRLMSGKKVFEILPDIDWGKGRAIRWIMEALKISWTEASVVYIGDDITDEDAFRIIRTRGIGILVSDISKESTADFRVSSTDEVKKLLKKIIKFY